jgi:hypothetical protein
MKLHAFSSDIHEIPIFDSTVNRDSCRFADQGLRLRSWPESVPGGVNVNKAPSLFEPETSCASSNVSRCSSVPEKVLTVGFDENLPQK